MSAAGGERLDGMKLVSSEDVAGSKNAAKYLPLMMAYPQLAKLLFVDAEWANDLNVAQLKGMADYRYHGQPDFDPERALEPGRNYSGWGISADLTHRFWNRYSQDSRQAKGFALEAMYSIISPEDFNAGFDQIPRLALMGINGSNPYGDMMGALSVSAQSDASNKGAKEGYVKEMEFHIANLINTCNSNPVDLQVLLSMLSVQTHLIQGGNVMLSYYGGPDTNQGTRMIHRAVENTLHLRRFLLEKLTSQIFADPKGFLTAQPTRPNTINHNLIYHGLSWIIQEAPDHAPIVARALNRVVNSSGLSGAPVPYAYEPLYIAGYLARQARNNITTHTKLMSVASTEAVSIPGNMKVKQEGLIKLESEIVTSCNAFIEACGAQAFELASTENYAQIYDATWLSNQVQYLSNALYLGDDIVVMNLVNKIIANFEVHDNIGTVKGGDFRLTQQESSFIRLLHAARSMGFVTINRLKERNTEQWKEQIASIETHVKTLNETLGQRYDEHTADAVTIQS